MNFAKWVHPRTPSDVRVYVNNISGLKGAMVYVTPEGESWTLNVRSGRFGLNITWNALIKLVSDALEEMNGGKPVETFDEIVKLVENQPKP